MSESSPRSLLALLAISIVFGLVPRLSAQESALHTALAEMRQARSGLDHAANNQDRAKAWLALQKASDRLVAALPNAPVDLCSEADPAGKGSKCPGAAIVRQARTLGMAIYYCSSGESWLAAVNGYEEYLKLWLEGPEANEAWWKTRVAPPCCDECSSETPEDYRNMIQLYADFLKRFPGSPRRTEAEKQIRYYERLLKAAPSPNQPH